MTASRGSGLALALALPFALLAAQPHAAAETAAAPPTKKHQRLADKAAEVVDPDAAAAWRAELARRIGKPPPPVINIFNTRTHETVAIDAAGGAKGVSAAEIRKQLAEATRQMNELANKHLRCHFTNEPTEMDARLFAVLSLAARHFGVERVEIISGFRAEKYNLVLRKKGREVARNSHHTLGHAVDFRLPGVSTRRLRDWARRLRLGGVGYYPSSGFIHVDVGKIRTWKGK
jgi:uncharacterized protein YcbK (DUF882 family)